MRLLGQILFVALVIGTSVTAAATERVTLSLVLSGMIGWGFVPLAQLGTGLWLTRQAAAGRRQQALEQYFDTHVAWSLWILAVHALFVVWPVSRRFALLLLSTGLLPGVLTARALLNLCRRELGMSERASRRAVAVHQGSTCLAAAAYVAWASAYVPRVVGLFS